ncbi:MAG: transporter permease [Tardiphaga sp.]|jgi:polar amino acid transport system permease protein|nr:transporter permease [Tardiphaga sp.]
MELFLHYISMPYMIEGISVTLQVTALGLAGGLILGVILAWMQLSSFRPLASFARIYAVIFRGTPLILQMVFAYNALPQIGIKLPAILAAGLALACNEAPFIAEMLRAGVLGVERGQVVAGQALGMTPGILMRRIIAPQAIRSMIPGFGNEAVSALKNSSLASVIAVQELTLRSTQLASSTFDFFSIFFASGLIYLVLTAAIAAIQLFLEWQFDLDRTKTQDQLMRFLPWYRPPTINDPSPKDGAAPDILPDAGVAELPPPRLRPESVDRNKRAETLARNNVAVEITNLHKSYDKALVLDGVDMTVRIGEVIALLGPSGSGKSTLLRCINNLELWNGGTIKVGGRQLGFGENGRSLSPRSLAHARAEVGVGMVFQQFNLFSHLTARENIAGPLRWVHGVSRNDADRCADELLERVGLSHRADALPRHLSGGQQQRVAIARAIAPNPSVLLFDEPTSALDPELVNEVLEVIRRLAVEDGLTMIISTHQLRFASEVADRVVLLAGGSIIEEGPAAEVLTNPKNPVAQRFLNAMDSEKA